MPPDDLALGPAPVGRLPTEVRDRFCAALRQVAGPLAACTGTALGYVTPSEGEWIASAGGCSCSRGPALRCLGGPRVEGRDCLPVGLSFEERPAGTVVVCCD